MKIVQIPEERYIELLRKEKRNTKKEIENILKFWEMIAHSHPRLKNPSIDDIGGLGIQRVIDGFKIQLEDLENDRT